jgi:uncharacterized membrane protein YphA (DoxX/SURF4 family)
MLSFPSGSSGLGLILLRLTASCLLLAIAYGNLSRGDASLLSFLAIILAIFLTLGLFTIVTSSLAAALTIALVILLHQQSFAKSAVTAVVCLALALLGAGAYSIDARLFGQRRVIWPNR